MPNLNEVISKELEKIGKIKENIEFAKSLKHLENYGIVDWAIYDNYVAAYIPPGNTYQDLRRAMGNEWEKTGSHTGLNGDVFVNFTNKKTDKEFTVIIDADLAKNTCERVQVGVVEKPVFKVICR